MCNIDNLTAQPHLHTGVNVCRLFCRCAAVVGGEAWLSCADGGGTGHFGAAFGRRVCNPSVHGRRCPETYRVRVGCGACCVTPCVLCGPDPLSLVVCLLATIAPVLFLCLLVALTWGDDVAGSVYASCCGGGLVGVVVCCLLRYNLGGVALVAIGFVAYNMTPQLMQQLVTFVRSGGSGGGATKHEAKPLLSVDGASNSDV